MGDGLAEKGLRGKVVCECIPDFADHQGVQVRTSHCPKVRLEEPLAVIDTIVLAHIVRRSGRSGVMRILISFTSLESSTALGDAFWLLDTPANRMIAKQARSSGSTDPNSALFHTDFGENDVETVLSVFDDVVLHHPTWREACFIGAELTAELSAGFSEMNLRAERTDNGFVVMR